MSKLQDAERIISAARQLLEVVKDDTISESDADKLVGQLLMKLDIAIQQYDQQSISHIKDRLEIEQPPRRKTRPKTRSKKQ